MIFATSLASGKPSIELKLRNTLKVSFSVLPIKSRWSTGRQVTLINNHLVLVEEVMRIASFVPRSAKFFQEARLFGYPSPKSQFFLWLTNLWWRSTKAKIFPLFQFQITIFPLHFSLIYFSSSEAGSYTFWWVDLIRNIALSHFLRTFLDF